MQRRQKSLAYRGAGMRRLRLGLREIFHSGLPTINFYPLATRPITGAIVHHHRPLLNV